MEALLLTMVELLPFEEAFDQDRVGGAAAAVEDQVDGRGLAGLPVLVDVLDLIRILGVQVGAVQAHQYGQGADVGVMAETEVGDPVAGAVQDGIGLLEEVLQDGNGVVLVAEHPGIGSEVGGFPVLDDVRIGQDAAHHAFMVDVREGGIQAYEVAGDRPHVAGEAFRGLEDPGYHLLMERVVPFERVVVRLVAGLLLGPFAVGGILLVARDHAVQGETGGLFADLDFRIALHEFLAESGHAHDATA